MPNIKEKNISKNPDKKSKDGMSSTVRNFTSLDGLSSCMNAATVSIDWFAAIVSGNIPPPKDNTGMEVKWMGEDLQLIYNGGGAGRYQVKYDVVLHGEHVGHLLTHPQKSMFLEEGDCKLEILNHVFYTFNNWVTSVLDPILIGCKMSFKSVNRLDIAIDGVNHIHPFLNEYNARILNRDRSVRMKNPRAAFNPKLLDEKKGLYRTFEIGTKGQAKFITVYNKSREIKEQSPHKIYIKEMWQINGIVSTEDIYRCELRLNSQGTGKIKDFDFERLGEAAYLMQIFRTSTENFFDFAYNTDSNISRCERIDLFQFVTLGIKRLEKIRRIVVEGAYKARLSIHNGIKNVLRGKILGMDIKPVLEHIRIEMELYNLDDWLKPKIPTWITKYRLSESISNEKLLLQLVKK